MREPGEPRGAPAEEALAARPLRPAAESLPDPLRAPAAAFDSCADELTTVADRLSGLLRPPVS